MADEYFEKYSGYQGSGALNFSQIVLQHINRCVINGSVEWHGGYWETKITSTGTEKKYIPNTRAVYTNSINQLRVLLLGYFDSEMTASDKKIKNKFSVLKKKIKENKSDSSQMQEAQDEKLEIALELFEELVKLAKRLNFFQEESLIEDVG